MSTTRNRRTFLGLTAGATVGALLHPAPLHAVETSVQVRAVAFDAFPITNASDFFREANRRTDRAPARSPLPLLNQALKNVAKW